MGLSRYADYRAVDGVMLPFRLESTSAITGPQTVQYTVIEGP